MTNGEKVRHFILRYTQFYDTCVIKEYDLLKAVNEEFKLSYQLNRFQDLYIDKMPQFKKWKGEDGYWMYERVDIESDPEWTYSRLLEFQEACNDSELYQKNEEFLTYVDYARRHNDKDFEIYILEEKVLGRL